MIGERLKHQFLGNDAWILSYREECFDQIGLKPSMKIPVYNGSLECEFRKYSLFDGKLKIFRSEGGVIKTDDEKKQMAERHRFKKNREFKKRLEEEAGNNQGDIRSFTFHHHFSDIDGFIGEKSFKRRISQEKERECGTDGKKRGEHRKRSDNKPKDFSRDKKYVQRSYNKHSKSFNDDED